MCFSGACPEENYHGECTASRHLGLMPCEVEEAFAEDDTEPELEAEEDDE